MTLAFLELPVAERAETKCMAVVWDALAPEVAAGLERRFAHYADTAKQRLQALATHGPTRDAFTFKTAFTPSGSPLTTDLSSGGRSSQQ